MPPGTDIRDVRRLLEGLAAVGSVIVVVGDTGRLTNPTRLGGYDCGQILTDAMREGRSLSLTVIALIQSTNYAAAGIKDQATAVMIGASQGAASADFAEIAGIEKKTDAHRALKTIKPHEWILSDHLDGEINTYRAMAPAPGWCSEAWPPPRIDWGRA